MTGARFYCGPTDSGAIVTIVAIVAPLTSRRRSALELNIVSDNETFARLVIFSSEYAYYYLLRIHHRPDASHQYENTSISQFSIHTVSSGALDCGRIDYSSVTEVSTTECGA